MARREPPAPMSQPASLLEELRLQYEAARASPHAHADVPDFQTIDKRLRTAFRWLEKAIAYLDGVKPPIAHRFDLGQGLVFGAPRFDQGFVGQHEQRIVGFPVLDQINISYTIAAAAPPARPAAREGHRQGGAPRDDAAARRVRALPRAPGSAAGLRSVARDLGLDRSEIGSAAAEAAGMAERTRTLSLS